MPRQKHSDSLDAMLDLLVDEITDLQLVEPLPARLAGSFFTGQCWYFSSKRANYKRWYGHNSDLVNTVERPSWTP